MSSRDKYVLKCCVNGCNSTSRTHRLFNIPRNDNLRELWLTFLIPHNINLSVLSKDVLIHRRVCQKHFDRHQFDKNGNRLRQGYPSLFSTDEILHGIPLTSSNLSDHQYAQGTHVIESTSDLPLSDIEESNANVSELQPSESNLQAAKLSDHQNAEGTNGIESTIDFPSSDIEESYDIIPEIQPSESNLQAANSKDDRVTCVCCNSEIVGNRYTCLQCLAVDLCSSCETADLHPKHVVLRLPNSVLYEAILHCLKPVRMALHSLSESSPTLSSNKSHALSRRINIAPNTVENVEISEQEMRSRKEPLQPYSTLQCKEQRRGKRKISENYKGDDAEPVSSFLQPKKEMLITLSRSPLTSSSNKSRVCVQSWKGFDAPQVLPEPLKNSNKNSADTMKVVTNGNKSVPTKQVVTLGKTSADTMKVVTNGKNFAPTMKEVTNGNKYVPTIKVVTLGKTAADTMKVVTNGKNFADTMKVVTLGKTSAETNGKNSAPTMKVVTLGNTTTDTMEVVTSGKNSADTMKVVTSGKNSADTMKVVTSGKNSADTMKVVTLGENSANTMNIGSGGNISANTMKVVISRKKSAETITILGNSRKNSADAMNIASGGKISADTTKVVIGGKNSAETMKILGNRKKLADATIVGTSAKRKKTASVCTDGTAPPLTLRSASDGIHLEGVGTEMCPSPEPQDILVVYPDDMSVVEQMDSSEETDVLAGIVENEEK